MNIEKMREEFEVWVSTTGLEVDLSRGNHGCYLNPPTHWLYCAWIASRAAIEVELPKRDGVNMYGADVLEINDVRAAIESAGLKVKS